MDSLDLDVAYKYPFAPEAKRIASELGLNKIDSELLRFGKIRVEEALNNGAIEYVASPFLELKKKYLISYIYARMLVSALNNRSYIGRYAIAEARRSSNALKSDSGDVVIKICGYVGIDVSERNGLFEVSFIDFVSNIPRNSGLRLPDQTLENGIVTLARNDLAKIVEEAIFREIRKGLPIDLKSIPREVVEYAKTAKIVLSEIAVRSSDAKGTDMKRYAWIEKLLNMPIGDVRHRTVNLILAPYLTNVRDMIPENAAAVIIKYIERCKEINPDTKINESYINYQCRYAKTRGLRPMTLERAADMLKGTINLDEK